MKKKIFTALLVICIIVLGFLREYIFVSINEKTGMGPGGSGSLFIWKWVLTFVFSLLYFFLSAAILLALFNSKKYIWLAAGIYAALFIFALIAGACGYLFFSFEKAYPFVRTILGIAQSPIVMIILVPACFFSVKNSSKKEG